MNVFHHPRIYIVSTKQPGSIFGINLLHVFVTICCVFTTGYHQAIKVSSSYFLLGLPPLNYYVRKKDYP